jgi:hypothetical protein
MKPKAREIVALADHVITGEADVKFAEVCRQLLNFAAEGQRTAEAENWILNQTLKLRALRLFAPLRRIRISPGSRCRASRSRQLASPYELYTDEDLKTASSTSRPHVDARSPASSASPRSTSPSVPFPRGISRLDAAPVGSWSHAVQFVDRTFICICRRAPRFCSSSSIAGARTLFALRDGAGSPARTASRLIRQFPAVRCSLRSAFRPLMTPPRKTSAAGRTSTA